MDSYNPNKHLKEQFVSNLTGSSKLEIFFLVTNLSILILLRHCIGFNGNTSGSVKKDDNATGTSKNFKAYVLALTVDFLVIAVPYILFVTVLAKWTYGNTILVVLFLLFMRPFKGKIFPRKYAKTETYGTGLMDLGVGSFVVANSLVSRQARGISNTTSRNGLYSTAPLILLGAARLISTTSVNYQVHVGEYGVHWNFFFTLAAVTLLTSIIDVHPNYYVALGSSILFGYQVLLSCGLNKYLLSAERGSNILSQNKEGVFSIFGYWGMYLLGVGIGRYLFFGNNIGARLETKNWTRTRAWTLCICFWSLNLLLDWYVERTSRRTCNLAYVCFSLAVSLQKGIPQSKMIHPFMDMYMC